MLATSLLLAAALAPQGADECSNALDLGVGPTSVAFDTSACSDTAGPATTSAEQQCATLSNDVWFLYTASMSGVATFSTCGAASFDTELAVWQGADCAAMLPLGCNDDAPGCAGSTSELEVAVVAGGAYLVQLGYWSSSGAAWGAGTLSVTESIGACTLLGDDAWEDNDDCVTAAPMIDGTTAGLVVQGPDDDFFRVTVPPGGTLQVDALFSHAAMDLDLYLWDPAGPCGTQVAGEGTMTGALAVGFSASDNERISYTNASALDEVLVFEVTRFDGDASLCTTYDLVIAGAAGALGIGANYCAANPNSTGSTGRIGAFGSTAVVDDDVTLTASRLPVDVFGFFLVSRTQGFAANPAGSEGNLCLDGAIGRYVASGQIQSTGMGDTFALVLDLSAVPQPSAPVAVAAGETWRFQAWHRDAVAGVATSNFTDATSVVFF